MSGPEEKPRKELDDESTLIGLVDPISRVSRSLRMAWLEQVRGPGAPAEFALDNVETVLGRADDADISINNRTLSRRHAVFRKSGSQVRCQDLESSNGIYLNGVKAHGADLFEGDTLQIGDLVLVFHEGL